MKVVFAFPIPSVVIKQDRNTIFIHEVATKIVHIIQIGTAPMAVNEENGVA